jgi:hypothetical protein
MATQKSSAPHAHPSTEDHDHHDQVECPHACYEGVVYIGHLVEEDGEEIEAFETVPCRKCVAGEEA